MILEFIGGMALGALGTVIILSFALVMSVFISVGWHVGKLIVERRS